MPFSNERGHVVMGSGEILHSRLEERLLNCTSGQKMSRHNGLVSVTSDY